MLSDEFIKSVNDHITSLRICMKPSEAYKNYVNLNEYSVKKMKSILMENEYNEKEAIQKIKKIYKNKYFVHQKANK